MDSIKGVNQVLITKEILKKVPNLYGQEDKGADAIAYAKFFSPNTGWKWYMTEFDPDTLVAFGWVEGFANELGYFSINDFIEMNKKFEAQPGAALLGGVTWIERDPCFKPTKLRDIFALDEQSQTEKATDRAKAVSEASNSEHSESPVKAHDKGAI